MTETKSAFDAHHPPEPALIDQCVHCGFCLPACPTYVLWGREADSPRGRIYLMKMASDGETAITPNWVEHIDTCLGCVSCMTACPSGVDYGKLIEATRAQVERLHRRPLGERLHRRMLFQLFPRPDRLRLLWYLLAAYQRSGLQTLVRRSGLLKLLPLRLRALETLAPKLGPRQAIAEITPAQGTPADGTSAHGTSAQATTAHGTSAQATEAQATEPPGTQAQGTQARATDAQGTRRMRVGLVLGCVQREFLSEVNAATVRTLAAEGCEVVSPPEQPCCGALLVHAGEEAPALVLARRMIDVFEKAAVDVVVTNAGGCGSNVKDYGHLLRDDPQYAERAHRFSAKCKDVTEVLDELGPRAIRHPLKLRVVYHDSCHLQHAQRVRTQPRSLLAAIPGLELIEIPEGAICCGSAGIYNLVQPKTADELADRKAQLIAPNRPDAVATGNPGCMLQIGAALARGGHPIPVVHTIQLLDASIRNAPPPLV